MKETELSLRSPGSGPSTKRVAGGAGKAGSGLRLAGIARKAGSLGPCAQGRPRVPTGFRGGWLGARAARRADGRCRGGLYEQPWPSNGRVTFLTKRTFQELTDTSPEVFAGQGGRCRARPGSDRGGRGGSPKTLCTGVYCKSSRKSFLQSEGQ